MKNTETARDLLIALHATPALDRGAVCLLARDAERWAGRSPRAAGALAAELGLPRDQVRRALLAAADAPRLADRERERAEAHGGRLLTRLDPGYPEALGHLSLQPPVLCVRSRLSQPGQLGGLLAGPAVAIVGSREAGEYGLEAAELFARELAAHGVAVISGFARGIDAAAHRGALAAPAGRTVAVLGCGLGVDYPRGHARLGDQIAARGALVTEFPCGTTPRAWHFPVRNRIIAALSAGTLVVEATARSGSLVTVRHALDLGREVWAVPGRIIDPRAAGPNALIRDGAALVQQPRDVLESLGLRPAAPAARGSAETVRSDTIQRERPPGLASTVLDGLDPGGDEATPEALAERAAVTVDRVLAALLELELGGWIVRRPGPRFARAGG